jgi:gluconokinase
MQFIIGIDIGTSGTKALAVNREGEVLYSTYVSYAPISDFPDEQELDPNELLQAVIKTIQDLLLHLQGNHKVMALSFSCAMHSLIAVDNMGLALTRAITWADLRSKEFAAKLKGTEMGNRIYEHTGTPIHAMSPLCKIIWLKDTYPEIFARAKKFISIKEFIWFQFFGKYQVDYSIASATGLFDIRTLAWYSESLSAAGIEINHLSEPVPPTHMETNLSEEFQKNIGLFDRVPFIIGANDGCLANLGSNAVLPGELALTIGTSGAVRVIAGNPQPDPEQRIFNYILTERLYVCGGAINNGGNVVKWFVDYFEEQRGALDNDLNSRLEELVQIDPGSEGLIFLPYLFGERSPIWDSNARAVFFGVHSGHRPGHFLRSIIEGIGFALYQTALALEDCTGPIQKIIASGGFIKSKLWLQLIADIFNKPVFVTEVADASAVGAAIMGWHALEEIPLLNETREATKNLRSFVPDRERNQIYMKHYSVFSVLYGQLINNFNVLSEIQKEKQIIKNKI